MQNYILHYTSADAPGDDASWSVYREEYVSIDHQEPIEGLTVKISSHPNEDEARAEAERLQGSDPHQWPLELRAALS